MPALRFNKLLSDSVKDNDYLHNISITSKQNKELVETRDLVRRTLRDGVRNWRHHIEESKFITPNIVSDKFSLKQPKFRMQGSFAYKTLNAGAYVPPQDIDLDDGLFLPVAFDQNASYPATISQGLFTLVEQLLSPLCEKRGWQLKKKDTCVRVQLQDQTHAHMDIALYAVNESHYTQLREAASSRFIGNEDMESDSVFDSLYRSISKESILLAHREKGWIRSDPRLLQEWFDNAIRNHGHQLRRVCRYIKGWRDFRWKHSEMSSIAIMRMIVDIFDAGEFEFDSCRDDLAIEHVASKLPMLLRQRIENPVLSGAYLDEGWEQDSRNELILAAQALHSAVAAATQTETPNRVIQLLRQEFGARIPDDVDLIQHVESVHPTKAASSATLSIAASTKAERAHAKEPTTPVTKRSKHYA